jgi:DNA-binding HxlR family transcriptional regulator
MKWDDVLHQQCSVARASSVLGDRWTMLILSDCFLGVRNFDQFQERLEIPRTTLANRLQKLEQHGVLYRKRYQEKPDRFEYRLTEKGRDLYPVIATILNWGDRYYVDEAGPPILRKHVSCGHDIQPILHCPECSEAVDAFNTSGRARPRYGSHPDVKRTPVAHSG